MLFATAIMKFKIFSLRRRDWHKTKTRSIIIGLALNYINEITILYIYNISFYTKNPNSSPFFLAFLIYNKIIP